MTAAEAPSDPLARVVEAASSVAEVAIAHQEAVAPGVLLVFVWSRFAWLITRAFFLLGYAALYAFLLTSEEHPDPFPAAWAYVGAVAVLAVVFGGGTRAKVSKDKLSPQHEAYVASQRRRLVAFYQTHAPHKVAEVDAILAKYRGHESAMWERLEKKYGPPISVEDDDDDVAMTDAPPAASPARSAATTTPSRTPAARSPVVAGPELSRSAAVARGREDYRRAMDERLKNRLSRGSARARTPQ